MVEKLDRRAGNVELLYIITLAGIIAGIAIPAVDIILRTPKIAERYATKIYGDHKAPLTELERAEWYNDMHVEPGKKPTLRQQYFFRENYQNQIFF